MIRLRNVILKLACAITATFVGATLLAVAPTVTSVTAQQRYPWNGLVDITVSINGEKEAVENATCVFVATNCETGEELSIAHVVMNGGDDGSGTSWTRRFIWDTNADLGEVKIDDVKLTVKLTAECVSPDTFVGTWRKDNGLAMYRLFPSGRFGNESLDDCGSYDVDGLMLYIHFSRSIYGESGNDEYTYKMLDTATVMTNCVSGSRYLKVIPDIEDCPRPQIVQMPAELIVGKGDSVSVQAVVTGGEKFTFQWEHGGVDLGVNVSTLEFVAKDGCAGKYTVSVWNEYGFKCSGSVVIRYVSPDMFVGTWRKESGSTIYRLYSSGRFGNDSLDDCGYYQVEGLVLRINFSRSSYGETGYDHYTYRMVDDGTVMANCDSGSRYIKISDLP